MTTAKRALVTNTKSEAENVYSRVTRSAKKIKIEQDEAVALEPQLIAKQIKQEESDPEIIKVGVSEPVDNKFQKIYTLSFQQGLDHLVSIDPFLRDVINRSVFPAFLINTKDSTIEADQTSTYSNLGSFGSLGRGILGQQVSGAAAKAILRKFKRLFATPKEKAEFAELEAQDVLETPSESEFSLKSVSSMMGEASSPRKKKTAKKKPSAASQLLLEQLDRLPFPSPQKLADVSIEQLRTAGLSLRKAEYMKGLAEAFLTQQISDEKFAKWTDDEIVDNLVAIRGLGPWSADMFLLFGLQRMDVFSIGDLGVRRGFENYVASHPTIKAELDQLDWSQPLETILSLQEQGGNELARHCPGTSAKATNRKAALTPRSKKQGKKAALIETAQMEYVAHRFRPYRTAFQMVLWKFAATDIDIVVATS